MNAELVELMGALDGAIVHSAASLARVDHIGPVAGIAMAAGGIEVAAAAFADLAVFLEEHFSGGQPGNGEPNNNKQKGT